MPLLRLLALILAFIMGEGENIIGTAFKDSMPHLLELFSGTSSIGKVFAAAGWWVTSVDLEARFEPTLCMNVLDLEPSMIEPGTVEQIYV